MTLKLGKKAARPDAVNFKFDAFFDKTKLPTPPAVFGHWRAVKQPWGMLGNDDYGDCLVEGSLVRAPKSSVIYRAKYCGPLVTITTESGKCLTVTPNHAVLTPRGFVCANTVQQGDNLVSTRGPEPFGPLMDDFNDPPAPIDQVFSARSRIKNQGTMGPRAVDNSAFNFNGDELFIKGNVDVVGTDSLLHCEHGPAVSEPNTKNEIVFARELQRSFHRVGTSLQTFLRGWLSAFSNIGGQGYFLPFGLGHLGVAQPQGLRLGAQYLPSFNNFFFQMPSRQAKFFSSIKQRRSSNILLDRRANVPVSMLSDGAVDLSICPSEFKASISKPTCNGGPTDPQLFANLSNAFPGLIEIDRVVNVDAQWNVRTHIYDLSSPARWYVAQDIISHNCVWAGAAHETMMWMAEVGNTLGITEDDVLSDYSAVTGFVKSDPNTDGGTDMVEAASYRRKTGIVDEHGKRHKIDSYVALQKGSVSDLMVATYLFGATGVGIMFPDSAMDQFNQKKPWSVVPGPTPTDGHYIPCIGRNSAGNLLVVTWGRIQAMTPDFYRTFNDESLAYVSLEPLQTRLVSPEGYDIASLRAALKSLP